MLAAPSAAVGAAAVSGRTGRHRSTDVEDAGERRDGIARRLKTLRPDLPVVVLTAHGTIGSAVEAMKLGAFDYLTKPFTREQLRVDPRARRSTWRP